MGGLLHKVSTLLKWDTVAEGGVHNPDPLRDPAMLAAEWNGSRADLWREEK